MKKKIFLSIEFLLIFAIITLVIYNYYENKKIEQFYKIEKTNNNIQETNNQEEIIIPEEVENDDEIVKQLQTKYNNNDIKGALRIINEDYQIPILQSKDNDYYLNHLPDRAYNPAGSAFLDYRNNIDSSRKNVIYGHNSLTIKTPFTVLEKFYNKDYFNNHNEALLITENQVRKYKLFSLYVETSDFSYINPDLNNNDYINELNKFKNKSWYNVEIDLNVDTNILLLQTCSKHRDYAKYNKKFLILVFAEIK